MGSIPACAGEPSRYWGSLSRFSVYPRVCGGTPSGGGSKRLHKGLSPRVRGNPKVNPNNVSVVRSIPACAGEPLACTFRYRRAWVYPRVCGGTNE